MTNYVLITWGTDSYIPTLEQLRNEDRDVLRLHVARSGNLFISLEIE
jgi:hypothetical protein